MSSFRGFVVLGALALSSAAGAQPVALGLTQAQLEDADLIDTNGVDIGDVEYVITDSGGQVVALAIDVDRQDPQPDKLVNMPLKNLRAVSEQGDPGDFNIITTFSASEVMSLPAVTARR